MVRAVLICSEGSCPTVYEAYGPFEEIEALACDCGCGLHVLGWVEPVELGPTARRDVDLLDMAA